MMKSKMMQRRPLLAAFFLPVMIMLFIVIAKGIHPFGERSFLRIDLYNQYFPFFTEYWRKLHEGGSFSYSRYLGLGGSFAGVFAYYLASPLHLILLICPEKWIQECMVLLIITKLGLCGLTFAWWLKEHFGTDSYLISAFGLLYALSGFTAAYNWNIMWLDVVYLAPVVIAGLARLIDISAGRRKRDTAGICLYPIALGLAIWCNYYLCIMLCIFLVLWFVIMTLDLSARQKGAAFARFTIGSLIGGALSAIVSLPGVLALRVTKFDNPDFSIEIKSYFNILQALARRFVLTECEVRNDHWPNGYCGVIILLLVPLWFIASKRSWKIKTGVALMLAFFWASYTFNILAFFWHGLNFPDSLPARQSYLHVFLVLTIAFEALGEIRPAGEIPAAVDDETTEVQGERRRALRGMIIASICGAAFILICCLFGRSDKVGSLAMIMTALYFVCYVIVTASYHMRSYGRKLFVGLLLVAIFSETGMHTYKVSVPTTKHDPYVQGYETNRAIVSALHELTDAPFYRIDEREWKTKNDGVLASYPSATYFSSTASGGVENLYRKLGMASSKVFYHMDGAVPLTTALLGVRYIIDPEEYPADGFFKPVMKTDELGDGYADRTVYEALDTLPIGYMIPTGLEEKWEEEIRINKENGSNTPVANLNALVR
nr:YfhO family protein [Lachnospiraceae bacterium]